MNKDLSCFKLTGDDYGYCPLRNKGMIQLIQNGSLNHISAIMNTQYLDTNISKDDVTVGLHLNLTEGYPLSHDVSSLLDEKQVFLGKHGFREKLKAGNILEKHIESECNEQINKYHDVFGVYPPYIDGHQHVHILPIVRTVLAQCMKRFNIEQTRLPYEIDIQNCCWIESERLNFYKDVCNDALQTESFWKSKAIKTFLVEIIPII